ncbi:hypothetical protein T05_12911, partial [Trichinella murrelli]
LKNIIKSSADFDTSDFDRNLILTDRLTNNKDDRQSLAFCLLSVAVWIGVGRENVVDPDRPDWMVKHEASRLQASEASASSSSTTGVAEQFENSKSKKTTSKKKSHRSKK